MTTSGSGTVKWQQVSEDLVPVNISAITEAGSAPPQRGAEAAPEGADRQAQLQQQKGNQQVIFHVTAYNSQVEKILDVRLVQPGKTSQTHIDQLENYFMKLPLS